MPHDTLQQHQSVLPQQSREEPTIKARPVQAETVVGPIRRRFRGSQIVWYILGFIEVVLFVRFFLEFIGANAEAGFTRFITIISLPFAGPFVNVVTPARVDTSVFDWSLLLAMVIYALIAWGIVKIIVMSKPVSDLEAHEKLEGQQ